ncbi:hypothetical protein JCM11491_005602 [Sporobolomyces phaffii]
MPEGSASPPRAYPIHDAEGSHGYYAPPPQSTSNPWTRTGTFLLSGSTAPPIVNTRRAPPLRGRASTSSPGLGPPVLYRNAKCSCCATSVSYPRDSTCFSCTVCGVTNDLAPIPGQSRVEPGITRDQVFNLCAPASDGRDGETDEQLARRLHQVELGSPASLESDDLVSSYIVSTFSSLETLDQSFLSSIQPSPPLHETLEAFYTLIKSRPEHLRLLETLVGALLRRPGSSLDRLKGNWIVALMESPTFSAIYSTEPYERRGLYSKFVGLLSNVPSAQHHHVVTYLSQPSYPSSRLRDHIQLLVPHISHVILSDSESSRSGVQGQHLWAVRAGAKVASVLLAARNARSRNDRNTNSGDDEIKLSEFYVTAIDALGEDAWIQDFLEWEESALEAPDSGHQTMFQFCQYPFLLSLGIKKRLLEFENQRQITDEAEAAVRSNLSRSSYRDPYTGRGSAYALEDEAERQMPLLMLNIRRDRLVADSLHQISGNRQNLRKSLRIRFEGEEGIDAGGLRKEWFLLLCRSLFSPSYGMFNSPDDESNLSWFNPGSVGMVDEEDYWLLGAVVGMGLYHADTLDVPLPLVTYKKLLREPSSSLEDLAQFQPSLARGLRHLLAYEGDDVEQVFCRTFVGTYEAWGETVLVDLCEGGRDRPVTSENRREFVSRYVDFLLNTSVSTQFEAFSAGFHQVCSGNALSLLRGEELELVVRGSDEPLDVETLKSVTTLHGFYEDDRVIENFWRVFGAFGPARQRKLLAFITSSDRVPATGLTALHLKITCLGRVDSDRLPTSHSCFNELRLWLYDGGAERLEGLLTRAMEESEGFGLR